MRSPTDVPQRPRRLGRLSRRFWIGLAFVVLLVGFLSLRNLAVLWTDQMWFSSVGLSKVFSTLLMVKLVTALPPRLIWLAEVKPAPVRVSRAPPAVLPPHWLDVRASGHVLMFVETQFSDEGCEALVRTLCDGVREIDAKAMTLRSIFTTLAPAARTEAAS